MSSVTLTAEQNQVIQNLEQPILLLASAGTGKTEVLAQRVAKIIETKKAQPEEILCLTFTNRACKEMQTRIGEEATSVCIKTFHGFCFSLIKEYAKKYTDLYTDFMIYDEDECKDIIKSIAPSGNNITTLYQDISRLKQRQLQTKRSVEANEQQAFLKQYQQILNENHALDFADLLLNVQALLQHEQVRDELKTRYKYIHIDEVQDTSDVEYEIITHLFGDAIILLTGDLFQTIYEWRGSTPDNIFASFRATHHPLEISFSKNYRATQRLTNLGIGYLKNCFPHQFEAIYPNGLSAASVDIGEAPQIEMYQTIAQEARGIYQKLNQHLKPEEMSKACILVRSNKYAQVLSQELNQIPNTQIQFTLIDEYKFFRRKEIKDVLAFLKLRLNSNDAISFKRILNLLPTGIGEQTLRSIESNEFRSVGILLSDYLQPDVLQGHDRYDRLQSALAASQLVVFDVETTGVSPQQDDIIQIAAVKINQHEEVIEKFVRFIKPSKSVGSSALVHGFSDEYLAQVGEDKTTVLAEFLSFIDGCLIVGHNVTFDLNMLRAQCEQVQLSVPQLPFYDTLDLYRRFYPNLENHKLETLSRLFDTAHKSSHDAYDDILATAELLIKVINHRIIPTRDERLHYYAKHARVFTAFYEAYYEWLDVGVKLSAADLITHTIKTYDLLSRYTEDERENRRHYLGKFYRLLKTAEDKTDSPQQSVEKAIQLTALSNGELEESVMQLTKHGSIPIITAHQAKGLEYETVVMSGLTNSTFPTYQSLKNNNIDEEKRLFYVAMTRAKKHLIMTYTQYNERNYKAVKSCLLDLLPRN